MAVVPRVATLRLDDISTHTTTSLQYVATAAVQDTPAGQSVTITTVRSAVGSSASTAPDTLTLNLYTDAGTLIRAFTLAPATASQVSTFFLTADGTATGAPRAGTVEIALRATRTTPTAYDIETDGSPNTQPTGFDSHLDRGWIRGTTTATTALSNISLGGAKSAPAEYDESLFARTTLGAALYNARFLDVALSSSTPPLSGSTNSATSGNFDATFANVVDDRFPAAVTNIFTSLVVSNSTLTGQPATVLTATNDSIDVDPRLTATHHFQVDDTVFARSKNETSREMLSTQTGFIATRLTTARTASGINGLALTQTLTPAASGSAVGPTATTTATRDAQSGWSELLTWASSKPGGSWIKTTDVTSPDIDPDAYVISGSQSYTMLAPDPNVIGWPYLSVPNANEADHAHAGDTLSVTLIVTHQATGKRLLTATDVTCSLVRYHNGQYQFLDSDDVTWTDWVAETVIFNHPMTESPAAGSGLWSHEFNNTGTWGNTDILGVTTSWKVGGTPYRASIPREFVGTANAHSSYGLDPIGLAVSGVLSTR